MPFKPRIESNELRTLKQLNSRMSLAEKDKKHYLNLKKGYEGEVLFDSMTEKYESNSLILNDLLLKVNNTTFQIDTLIVHSETIYLYEVKNLEGDYYYEAGRFYKKNKAEILNPHHQLSRGESLLRQLLTNLGFNLPIQAAVVFVNPEFTLYQAPLNTPFIFPTQIQSHLKKFNTTSSKGSEKHQRLAEKLISLHIKESPFMQLPVYDYDQLQKGIICENCHSPSLTVKGKTVSCGECGNVELVHDAVMRSVQEFQLLFPNEKITTSRVHEWCKIVDSRKRIWRILDKNLQIEGVHQWSFYK